MSSWSGTSAFQIIVVIFIGLLCGLASVLLYYGVVGLENFFFSVLPPIAAPAIGGLIVGLFAWLIHTEKGAGISSVMEALALRNGRISGAVAPVTLLAATVTIGSGGSAGREGPIVAIGSSIGSSVARYLHLSSEQVRNMVAAGAAAGLAAAFNIPLAGVIFAMEVILGDFSVVAFSNLVVAAVAAAAVSHGFLGDSPAFIVPNYQLISYRELFFYALLGLTAAVVSKYFIRILYGIEDLFEHKIKAATPFKPFIGGAIVGLIGFAIPQIFGAGDTTIELVLQNQLPLWLMAILIVLKPIATAFTVGSGGTGGVFMPSLFTGAVLGGTFGVIVHQFFPMITAPAGAYAIVGMGALLAGSMQAPLTAIVMLLELTRNYQIALPLMAACSIAYLLANLLGEETVYSYTLLRKGIRLKAGKDLNILQSINAGIIMERRVQTVAADTTVGEVVKLMQASRYTGYPVIDNNGDLVGIITLSDIRDIPDPEKRLATPVRLAMTTDLILGYLDEDLADISQKFMSKDIGRIPVVDRQNPAKLLGLITRTNLISAYNKALVLSEHPEIQRENHA